MNRNITALNCARTQGQPECFACAAPSRICEQCKKQRVAVSVAGWCGVCLTQALLEETTKPKPEYHLGDRVYCQMVSKEINTSTCLKMQGVAACQDCPAPSRRCEQCENRPVAISRAGLCLTCTVEEYGDGWKPLTQAQLDEALGEQQQEGALDQTGQNATPTLTSQDSKTTDKNLPQGEDMKATTVVAGQDVEITNEDAILSEPQKRQVNLDPELIRRGRELVIQYGYASAKFLQTHLKTAYKRAHEILDHLEDQGIVGPANGKRAREVYAPNDSDSSAQGHITHPVVRRQEAPNRTFAQMVNDARAFILTTGETRMQKIRDNTHLSGKHIGAVMQALVDEGTLSTTKRGRGNTRSILVPMYQNLRAARIQRIKDFILLMGEQSKFAREVLTPTIDDLTLLESVTQALGEGVAKLQNLLTEISMPR